MSLLSDKKRLRQKELGVFQELYEHYYSRMVLFAMSLVYDPDEAGDIVQEVFYYLWDKAETIEIKTSLKNYLFTAVRNAALNRIRHYHIHDAHAGQIREAWYLALEPDPDPDEERLARIQEVVDTFPSQMQKIFLLRTRDEKRYEEIAQELGISLNTVKTQIKRAFQLLRKKLCL
jgi:RNA polymerase sigma-70 factor (ECF subfamily)